MTGIDVALVGDERQENLGLRSIMAYLQEQGKSVALVPFLPEDKGAVLSAVRELTPRLVGFSIIFQYALDQFGDLMGYLRSRGVKSHFTCGGHFPSLRPTETLELLPCLDSVVRFEGELTLTDLLNHVERPEDWRRIPNLAFRDGARVVTTEVGPSVPDLDALPPVHRDEPRYAADGIKVAPMLASRGCLFNCSFCSIRQFYGQSRGELRRVRSPRAVTNEMLFLYERKGVRFFNFQDDDFAVRTSSQLEWLDDFLRELDRTGLAANTRWKVSCRVDELRLEVLERMRDHGLMGVFLGVESANEAGLRTLNKHVTAAQNLAAVELLKRAGLAMSMGFMMFDPSSTFETIRENLGFLRAVGEDGYFPINFCKMLPYAGTPIEAELSAAGRLTGTVTQPNYGFVDPAVDWYEALVQQTFARRNFGADGNVALLQQADFQCRLAQALGLMNYPAHFQDRLRRLISRTNKLALDTMELLIKELTARGLDPLLDEERTLVEIAEREWRGEMETEVELAALLAGARPVNNSPQRGPQPAESANPMRPGRESVAARSG